MTPPALTAPFLALVSAVAWLSTSPALAGADAATPAMPPAVRQAIATPESPAAAFERMLAARTPTPSSAVARDEVDALQAPFRAALWRSDAHVPLATAAATPPVVRK